MPQSTILFCHWGSAFVSGFMNIQNYSKSYATFDRLFSEHFWRKSVQY